MDTLETELARARGLDVDTLADAIESVGFDCTRCGACCKGYDPAEGGRDVDDASKSDVDDTIGDTDGATSSDGGSTGAGPDDSDSDAADATDREPHTATVFPAEIRELQAAGEYDWRDVARPMPYGLAGGDDASGGETFEWALQTDACGDCTFYEERDDGTGHCGVHDDRPLICRTYPFSVALAGTSQPMGDAVDSVALEPRTDADETGPAESDDSEAADTDDGMLRVHECEGLGRDIARREAEALAAALKQRTVRELQEAIGVRDNYEPAATRPSPDGIVVHDSEGAKRVDGEPLDDRGDP